MATKAPKMPKATKKTVDVVKSLTSEDIAAIVDATTKPAEVEYKGQINLNAIKKIDTDRLVDEGESGEIDRLASSLRMHGLLQPIGLVPLTDAGQSATGGMEYAIVYGRRRFLAARKLGWTSIDARVYKRGPHELVIRETENLQRKDLNPIEEAAAITSLLNLSAVRLQNHAGSKDWDSAPLDVRKKAVAIVAIQIGKPERWVRDRAFLARLDEPIRDQVLAGKLPIGHAREIARLADPRVRREAARACFDPTGRLVPLDEIVGFVSKNLFSLAQVGWKLEVGFGGRPACVECPHNSANQPGLFEHAADHSRHPRASRGFASIMNQVDREPKCGVCTMPSCYQTKAAEAAKWVNTAATAAERASREAKPRQREEVKARAIAEKLPAFVPVAAVEARLEERAAAASKRKAIKKAHPPTRAEYKPSPQLEAENKFRDAMHTRYSELCRRADAHYQSSPRGSWVMLQLARLSKPWQAAAQWNLRASAKALASKEWKALCEAFAKPPTLENIHALEKLCGTRYAVLTQSSAGGSFDRYGAAESLLGAIGVKLDTPMPTLDEFVAKAKGEKPATAAAAPSSTPKETPKAVRAKKPRKPKPADDEDEIGTVIEEPSGSDEEDDE